MSVYVVIPTIAGREEMLEQTLAGWKAQEMASIPVISRGHPTIGEAWQAGLNELGDVLGSTLKPDDLIVLAADDLVPRASALAAGSLQHWNHGETTLPSPKIYNPDGSLHSCGSLGGGMLITEPDPHGLMVATSPIPMLYAQNVSLLGFIPPIHYYADDWVSWRLKRADIPCVATPGFAFDHLEGKIGREKVARRAAADRAMFLTEYGRSS